MAERPFVYVHFELGVSWRARNPEPSRTHRFAYVSKNARERANQFPSQLPQVNTDYLTGPSVLEPRDHGYPHQEYLPPLAGYHNGPVALPSRAPRQPMSGHQHPQSHPQPNFHAAQYHQRRPRSQARSSHERGRSAPPLLNKAPWDANPEPLTATALPRRAPHLQLGKALPPTPGQFRLGHDDLPWSSPPFPTGKAEEGENDAPIASAARSPAPPTQHGQQHFVDDRDRARTKEMQSLATAMMTVDNGFEDQWWYQGPRLVNVAGDLVTPTAIAESYAPDGRISWPVANIDTTSISPRDCYSLGSPRHSVVDIVSPLSDFSGSASTYRHPLRRSLTTRSDELFI